MSSAQFRVDVHETINALADDIRKTMDLGERIAAERAVMRFAGKVIDALSQAMDAPDVSAEEGKGLLRAAQLVGELAQAEVKHE